MVLCCRTEVPLIAKIRNMRTSCWPFIECTGKIVRDIQSGVGVIYWPEILWFKGDLKMARPVVLMSPASIAERFPISEDQASHAQNQ
jgi:hypothetical protein